MENKNLVPPIIVRSLWALLFKHDPNKQYKTSSSGSDSLDEESRIALAVLVLKGHKTDTGMVKVFYNQFNENYRISRHTYINLFRRKYIRVIEEGCDTDETALAILERKVEFTVRVMFPINHPLKNKQDMNRARRR